MTDEQINAAIARALNADEHWMIQKDYCTDLNDMHEAEQILWRKDYNLRYDYVDELGKILNPTVWHTLNATDMLDATARDRAEAFLRALGKWEEVQG